MFARPRDMSAAFAFSVLPHAMLLAWLGTVSIRPPATHDRIVVKIAGGGSGAPVKAKGDGRPEGLQSLAEQSLMPPEAAVAQPAAVPPPVPVLAERPKIRAAAEPKPVKPAAAPAEPIMQAKRTSPPAASPSASAPSGDVATASVGDAGSLGSGPGSGGGIGGGDGPGAGSGSGPGKSAASIGESYRAQLVRWLEKHKRYPARALAMGMEDEVTVRIVIDARGRLRSKSIAEPGRAGIFDRAVEEMIERAVPFPPVPAELGGNEFEIVVPVSFKLDAASIRG